MTRWYRDLPLFWKLLGPFALLLVVVGVAGTFLIVRTLAAGAERRLDEELLASSVTLSAGVSDEAVSLVSVVRVGANIEGLAEAVASGDRPALVRLLTSVLSFRDVPPDLLVVTDTTGTGLVEVRLEDGTVAPASSGGRWTGRTVVDAVLQGAPESVGFIDVDGRTMLAAAGPVRTDGLAGVMVVAVDASAAVDPSRAPAVRGFVLYDEGRPVVRVPASFAPSLPDLGPREAVRRTAEVEEEDVAVRFAPLEVIGERIGTLAVAVPTEGFLGDVRSAAVRLALLLTGLMVAVVVMGAGLSRYVTVRVGRLLETNRALGRGDLDARAPAEGRDELGELARGLNQMAEELGAASSELESRVAQATEELRRLYEETVETAEARQRFFAQLSHDLRTPLFAILGNAEMMVDPDMRPKGRGWPQRLGRSIETSARHVLDVVDQLMELASSEAGTLRIEPRPVGLSEVMDALSNVIVPLGRRAGLSVGVDVPRDLPPVAADPERLKQIVLNLVSNAVKYTPEGGRVDLSASAGDGMVEVRVSDTGVGIPADARPHVFEPFYRVPGTEAQQGQSSSGLGLALTRRLVEAHGGTIDVEGREGGGTTFAFTLPVATTGGRRRRRART